MNSKTYNIHVYSFWCLVIQMSVGWILPLILFSKTQGIEFIALFVTANLFAYFLARKFGLRPIEITFDTNAITFKYLRSGTKKIDIDKIKAFSDFNFGGDKTFKLKLANRNITLYKSRVWNKNDDFEALLWDFKNFIRNQTAHDSTTSDFYKNSRKGIEYNDFFQTKPAVILFFFALLTIATLTYLMVINKINSYSGSLLVIAGLIGYIGSYLARKKN
ncbi:hypothetical protein SAMN04489724_0093 [Algoriphagus locisalis]|uniref:Uncharacterized protein n=1 Tax=Algoriphagus locisalis TaxID=305507 RepID=A0A1I7E576_9BACT|nr:hypothetical protein [Algoriphagus locisalis]SFU19076.1 hypothetical protein SAMN04489724_0093 [Algoriphagus locisalis]